MSKDREEFLLEERARIDAELTELRAEPETPVTGLPKLQMEVAGEYQGNAYPEQREYRIVIIPVDWESGDAALVVEDSSGGVVNTLTISAAEAEGVIEMAGTNHELDSYTDLQFPMGLGRTITWDVGGYSDHIVLSEGHIDEIAAWLRYATGMEEYDNDPEEWIY